MDSNVLLTLLEFSQIFLQVMEPFLNALTENTETRFPHISSLSVLSVFCPKQILTNNAKYGEVKMSRLAGQFPRLKERESDLVADWDSYRLRVQSPELKVL